MYSLRKAGMLGGERRSTVFVEVVALSTVTTGPRKPRRLVRLPRPESKLSYCNLALRTFIFPSASVNLRHPLMLILTLVNTEHELLTSRRMRK